MSNKVVYNNCFGGFGLSDLAFQTYLDLKGIKYERTVDTSYGCESVTFKNKDVVDSGRYKQLSTLEWSSLPLEDRKFLNSAVLSYDEIERHDPLLIKVVEDLGPDVAGGAYAKLKVQEIEGNQYIIDEYDGNESVVVPDNQDWTVIS